ncbi:MAG: hypothetical protein AB7G13_13760 [Lautropia sp.]
MSTVRTLSIASVALALCATGPAAAQEVYFQLGTEGIGVGYGQSLSPAAGIRGEANFGRVSRTFESDDVRYDTKLRLGGAGIYGDWFVSQGTFRLSGGLTVNDKKASGTGRSDANTVTLNGRTYSVVGEELHGTIEFPRVMPYLGVGWGHDSTAKGWGFNADIGMLIGSPKVRLSATPGLAAAAGADIEAERRSLQRDADDLKVFPVLKIGATYRF